MLVLCPQCSSELPNEMAVCANCGAGILVGKDNQAAPQRLQDNVLAALAYFTFIPALLLLVLEPFKRNRYLRFHAVQSIYLTAGVVVVGIGLRLVLALFSVVPRAGFFLGWLTVVLTGVAIFLLWLVLIVKALLGERFQAPLIGKLAVEAANRW